MKKLKFTKEQIVRILGEVAEGKMTHSQIDKKHSLRLGTLYVWRRKYAGVETDDLRRLRELECENAQLKRLWA